MYITKKLMTMMVMTICNISRNTSSNKHVRKCTHNTAILVCAKFDLGLCEWSKWNQIHLGSMYFDRVMCLARLCHYRGFSHPQVMMATKETKVNVVCNCIKIRS